MKKIFTTLILILALSVLPGRYVLVSLGVSEVAFAAGTIQGPVGPAAAPKPIPCIPSLPCISTDTQASGTSTRSYITKKFAKDLMVMLLGISSVVSVVMIIYGGVQMHIAMGVEDSISKAKKTIIWAIAGLVVSTLAAAAVTIVSRITIQ